MVLMAHENFQVLVGCVIVVLGFIILCYSTSLYKKLAETKYRNINAVNLTLPSLILIAIGTVVAILPSLFQFINDNRRANTTDPLLRQIVTATGKINTIPERYISSTIIIPIGEDTIPDLTGSILLDSTAHVLKNSTLHLDICCYGFRKMNSAKAVQKQIIQVMAKNNVSSKQYSMKGKAKINPSDGAGLLLIFNAK